ncbi:nuclear GTPase SLIP-GC-like [Archocentrus centrarchus]|uniref:nuclear GTPase SLIP-GC-like n=1 Tax=Archocentrus centrarchus TaxID=63155 RepID=UPI0011E9D776|nr:nuclear GTPase SLIP-GC-like [Archocentrus centrarchus]
MDREHGRVLPSTSKNVHLGKRKSNLRGEFSEQQSAKRQHKPKPGSNAEARLLHNILSDVKAINKKVKESLHDQDELNVFLKKKITDLDKDKKEQVGVFGESGAGKSCLINAIINEKNLLPSSDECTSACTSVMIKVEANMDILIKDKYQADIEFMTEEEWENELWSLYQSVGDKTDQEMEDDDDGGEEDDDSGEDDDSEDDDSGEEDDDHSYNKEKLSALYGEDWKQLSVEQLLEKSCYKDIQNLLRSGKSITCKTAKELSEQLIQYTRNGSLPSQDSTVKVKRWYWPLVKCVTVKVPNNRLLQHVTLVDLPGNGDCNKSRDEMWKRIAGECSTVWIVAEIKRAASKGAAWEILKSVSGLIGHGGECQRIHFICTKTDDTGNSDDLPAADVYKLIVERNKRAKDEVQKKFNDQSTIKKYFNNYNFEVFTVSSKEFLKRKHLNLEETEIPELQNFLQNLSDPYWEALKYVSGARGILSLIQGTKCTQMADKKESVRAKLEKNLSCKLDQVKKGIEEAYRAFEKSLSKGVEKSKKEDEKTLKKLLDKQKGSAFHKTLKAVVGKGGDHKTIKGQQINFNKDLAKLLTDSIDKQFSKTFPCAPWSDPVGLKQAVTHRDKVKYGPFNGVISVFSLDTDSLIDKFPDLELLLTYVKMEEENIKAKLSKTIREKKKQVYNSLTETIKENMTGCYEEAARFNKKDSLKKMKETIRRHVRSNNQMYEKAKNAMLEQLNELKGIVLDELKNTMKEAIELSLKNNNNASLPDVSEELKRVKIYHLELQILRQ